MNISRKKKQADAMPRVRGTLELHGKTYRARWMVDGQYYSRSTGTADREQAEQKLAEFLEPFVLKTEALRAAAVAKQVELANDAVAQYEDAQPALSIAEAWDAYTKSPRRRDTGESTLDIYARMFKDLVEWLHEHHPNVREMRQVSRAISDEYLAALGNRVSASTYNLYVALFKRMWSVLAAEIRLPKDAEVPWLVARKSESHHSRRELTLDELKRVCASTTGEMRVLFAIGLYTGLRMSDCALMEWSSIDLARGIISVMPIKTARRRRAAGKGPVIIPIHGALRAVLCETPESKRRGLVVPTMAAKYRVASAVLSAAVQRVFESVGITTKRKESGAKRMVSEVGFHSLRHSFVSLCGNSGVPLALVQSIVGHVSSSMTERYFHTNAEALRNAVGALPAIGAESVALPAQSSLDAAKQAFSALSADEQAQFKKWLTQQG